MNLNKSVKKNVHKTELTPAALAVLALCIQHSPISVSSIDTAPGTFSLAIVFAKFKETLLRHNKGSIVRTDSWTI